ncbi:hypothetical protein MIT9_P1494 [Methylomarinovum caldicuralii]|uniref:DUF4388 domain-containing protein n=1 Tax=Methylomarinovum caldicuralii TaxID=438856 RepID=A0AAU9CQW1_9GAMM|nr:hypothetical protein [Methylomarinovum caldicuralii]BCX81912.1 hypothetical protein MIT9_P1494 [Methylomarinovum caldicuralii]
MKVMLQGTSERFLRLLHHLLVHDCRLTVVEDPAAADVCLLDWDSLGAAELLERHRRRWPRMPVLLLALNPPAQTELAWVRKPLQVEPLLAALKRVSLPADAAVAEKPPPAPVPTAEPVAVNFRHYDPRRYLQGLLTRACRQALMTGIALRVETGWEPILVFPKPRAIWVDADDKKLRAFCRLPLQQFCQLAGEPGQGPAIVPAPEMQIKRLPGAPQRMDAFLWKVAWWNAGVRLPVSISPEQCLHLKRWPNLTRYWHPPQALRIAAAWYRQDMSPLRLARMAGNPETVASFISAASALGLVEAVETPQAPRRTEPQAPPEGFLKRILKRLRKAT